MAKVIFYAVMAVITAVMAGIVSYQEWQINQAIEKLSEDKEEEE